MVVINNHEKKNLLSPPKWNTLYYERTVDPSGLRILKMECVSLLGFEDVTYYRLSSFIIAVNNVSLWRWRIFSDQGLLRTLQGDWRFFASSWRDFQQPDSQVKKLIYMGRNTPFCAVSLYVTIIRNVTSTLYVWHPVVCQWYEWVKSISAATRLSSLDNVVCLIKKGVLRLILILPFHVKRVLIVLWICSN
jgi:hypothetical protein